MLKAISILVSTPEFWFVVVLVAAVILVTEYLERHHR